MIPGVAKLHHAKTRAEHGKVVSVYAPYGCSCTFQYNFCEAFGFGKEDYILEINLVDVFIVVEVEVFEKITGYGKLNGRFTWCVRPDANEVVAAVHVHSL